MQHGVQRDGVFLVGADEGEVVVSRVSEVREAGPVHELQGVCVLLDVVRPEVVGWLIAILAEDNRAGAISLPGKWNCAMPVKHAIDEAAQTIA
eukprot:1060103-Amphidinium_carterae.1